MEESVLGYYTTSGVSLSFVLCLEEMRGLQRTPGEEYSLSSGIGKGKVQVGK